MKKKIMNYLAICIMLCIPLTGCNSSTDDKAAASTPAQSATEPSTKAPEATSAPATADLANNSNSSTARTSTKVILLGAPGSGKGTQAEYLMKHFNIPKISTGDMLRAAVATGSPLGLQVKSVMDAGNLVSDDIIMSLIKERITKDDCINGFLFDGFPRTLAQATTLLQTGIDVDYVIDIQVADAEIIKRLTGRLVHPASGRSYHVEFNPPKVAGKDDVTGEALVQRDDDKEEVVKQRLATYHQQTAPLSDWYAGKAIDKQAAYNGKAKYISVSGSNKNPQEVSQDILKQLDVTNK